MEDIISDISGEMPRVARRNRRGFGIMLRMKICAMKNAILVFVGLVAGIAAANEPHAKGRLTLTFKESDPVGDFAEMKRRVPSSFDDKDDAGKDKPYNVSERTYIDARGCRCGAGKAGRG